MSLVQANYLANCIVEKALSYSTVVSARPDLKN